MMTYETKESAMVKAPILSEDNPAGLEWTALEIIDPHIMVAYLINEVGVEISTQDIQRYWQHLEEVKFPMATSNASSLQQHCPVGLYGDAAKITTEYGQYHCLGIFLNLPLWRPRSTRFSRFLLFSIKEELLVPNITLDAVFRRLTWSLNLLFTGQHPYAGPQGEELPKSMLALAGKSICHNSMKFVCTELRGDWKYHQQVFRFSSSWQATKVCFKCSARSRGEISQLYYHVDEDARWLQEELSLSGFLAHRIPPNNPCCTAASWFRFVGPGGPYGIKKTSSRFPLFEDEDR